MSTSSVSRITPTPIKSTGDRSLIIATAGHVDHGKTSLITRITGVDTDTLPEEKARGLSINLGYAYLHFDTITDTGSSAGTIGFVDVPGHTDFINNMLAGVGAVDAALLVVAADDGIMPQTREHVAILQLLGVSRLAIALTKIDRCDPARIKVVIEDIAALLHGSPLAGSLVFPVSNLDGTGIAALTTYLQSWLNTVHTDAAMNDTQYFRYLIDRSFTVKGIGTVVTGCARAGSAATGASVLHTGTGAITKLRGLRLDQTAINTITRGQRAAANITLNHTDLHRGEWLVDAALYHPVTRFDARLQFIVDEPQIVANAQYHLHIGASHHIVTLRQLDTATSGYYQVKSHDAMVAHFGDRFVIRDPSAQHTIAGGSVIDIFVPRRGCTNAQRLDILAAMDQPALAALQSLLPLLPEGIDLNQFGYCRNLQLAAIKILLLQLREAKVTLVELPQDMSELPVILQASTLQHHAAVILTALKTFHANNSNQQGISEPTLSHAVHFEGSHRLFHSILHALVQEGRIKRTGTLLHLPAHQTSLTAEEQQFLEKVRPILLQAGNVPPRTRELVDMTGIPLQALDRLLRLTSKAGTLIKVAENRYYLPETIMTLAEFAEKLVSNTADDGGFSVIEFRDATGIGRNLCIEILEYFDKVGYTRRDDNKRYLRTEKENIFGK